jgi:predicted component of type VI protein secretion system
LGEDGEPLSKAPVLVGHHEISFGREPTQATCVLDDPSVEALHARLRHDEEGVYVLSDAGSIAGTWVNYAPISTGGIRLEHGDLLHIGRVVFRFELLKPPPAPQPRIEPYAENP